MLAPTPERREAFLRDFWRRKDRVGVVARKHDISVAYAWDWIVPHWKK